MRIRITPKRARILAGFETMSDMAEAMEMPISTYQSKESGKTAFTIKEALVFADLCNKDFADIDFLWFERPESRTDATEEREEN